jgi:hypothetical protein
MLARSMASSVATAEGGAPGTGASVNVLIVGVNFDSKWRTIMHVNVNGQVAKIVLRSLQSTLKSLIDRVAVVHVTTTCSIVLDMPIEVI